METFVAFLGIGLVISAVSIFVIANVVDQLICNVRQNEYEIEKLKRKLKKLSKEELEFSKDIK